MKGLGYILAIAALVGHSSAQEVCGSNITLTDGETVQVTSPGYPEQYPNNANCLWKVHATDLSSLKLTCSQVDLQWTIFGCVDTIAFSDAENFNQLPSYCGNKQPPAELGFGDTVFIQFISDGNLVDNGFVCDITAKKEEVDTDCECGVSNSLPAKAPRAGKIFNSTPISKHQYPWLAAIMTPESIPQVLCGAVLINSHYVLTSSRCVQGVHPEDIRVRLGEHDLMNNNETPPHKIYDVEAIKIHPDFNSSNLANDLALIRVGEQILFEPNVRPACLPKGVMNLGQTQLIAAGWGSTGPEGTQVNIPREAMLDVEPPTVEECNAMLPASLQIGEGQLCTTALDGSDICTGDFGGPLVQADADGVFYLAAISSYNILCGSPDTPTVHSRIDYYSSWILAASGDSIQCGGPPARH